MYTIKVRFADSSDTIMLHDVEAGQTLLEIFLGNKIPVNHTCGGICSCTTCHIYVEKGMERIREKERREMDFLKRVKNVSSKYRLACQSLLLEGAGEIDLIIPRETDPVK